MRIAYLHLHEASGYAEAARRCMAALGAAGVEVTGVPFVPGGGPGLGFEPAGRAGLDAARGCDVIVSHLVPEYWPIVRSAFPGTPLVGHTVWETDRVPRHWPTLLEVADLVLVPTEWNADAMRRSGIARPIAVVPHVAAAPSSGSSPDWEGIPAAAFVCYTIGPWTTRKALAGVVGAYQRAFAGRTDTLLVLKTSARDFTAGSAHPPSRVGPGTTAWALARLLAGTRDPAPVLLVAREVDEASIGALHRRGDCFVSLSHGEGWSFPAFDAAAYGNPVVVPRHGGPLAYLSADSAFLVDHELVPVDEPGNPSYTPDQLWAEPSLADAAAQLRRVRDEPEEALARASRAQRRIGREFAPAAVARTFLAALDLIA